MGSPPSYSEPAGPPQEIYRPQSIPVREVPGGIDDLPLLGFAQPAQNPQKGSIDEYMAQQYEINLEEFKVTKRALEARHGVKYAQRGDSDTFDLVPPPPPPAPPRPPPEIRYFPSAPVYVQPPSPPAPPPAPVAPPPRQTATGKFVQDPIPGSGESAKKRLLGLGRTGSTTDIIGAQLGDPSKDTLLTKKTLGS